MGVTENGTWLLCVNGRGFGSASLSYFSELSSSAKCSV